MANKTLWCATCALNISSDASSEIIRKKVDGKVTYRHRRCEGPLNLRVETSKECPVCHTVGLGNYLHNRPEREVTSGLLYGTWTRRFDNEPCRLCVCRLADNEKRIAEIDAAKQGLTEYRLNSRPSLDLSYSADHERRAAASKAFCTLLFAMTEGTRKPVFYGSDKPTVPHEKRLNSEGNRAEWTGLMTPDAAAAFQDLYEMFIEFTERAYAAGKERGQNILLQLQSGELGLADFNEAIARRR